MDYEGTGGGGGFGGGGGGASQSQPQSGGRARRTYDEQSMIPVTIHMIATAQSAGDEDGGSLELADGTGRKVHHVRLVGAVRSVTDSSTNDLYEIEDGTGLIQVKQWHDDNDNSAMIEMRQHSLQENIYVKVVGQVKDYDGKKMIVAESIRPLTSGNELTHHMLEVVYSAEMCNKRRGQMNGSLYGGHGMMSGVGFSGPMGGGRPLASASVSDDLADQILMYIKSNDAGDHHLPGGVHIEPFIQQMMQTGRYAEPEIRGKVFELASGGQIYTTSGEDYYRCSS